MAKWSKTLGNFALQYVAQVKSSQGVSAFLHFFNFPNFQGNYLVSVKFGKDGLFAPKSRGSKVPLGKELNPAPPSPFEKNSVVNCIFIK